MTIKKRIAVFCLSLLFAFSQAAVQMHGLFTDNMILQRDETVAVYGSASAGEEVTVQFSGQSKTVSADGGGRWEVRLDSMEASSNGRTMTVTSDLGSSLSLTNILVGDIWIVSGQSNMNRWFKYYAVAKQDIAGVANDQIRIFQSDNSRAKLNPQTEVTVAPGFDDSWQIAEETYLLNFSPAGYYMADCLQQELNIPIGIIQACAGATAIESWLPNSVVAARQEYEFMTGNQWPFNVMTDSEIDAGEEMARKGTSGLYNYSVAPLRGFSFKGFAWYQGESNTQRPWIYRTELLDLINGWRADFGDPSAPFLVAQIAPYGLYNYERAAWLREAQAQALTLSNTALIATLDAGEYEDIHPQDKKTVGDRLASAALEMDGLPYNGRPPMYDSAIVTGGTVEIYFSDAESLSTQEVRMNHSPDQPVGQGSNVYVVSSGTLAGFEICAADQIFVEADAVISGNRVLVSSSGISSPVAVRYAWENFPLANLTSGDGRPVLPFRTDDFIGPFHPPVFDVPNPNMTAYRDAFFYNQLTATDPTGDPLTYSIVDFEGPDADWLSINPDTGAVGGTPPTEGDYSWIVAVRDEAFGDANSYNVVYTNLAISVRPPVSGLSLFVQPTNIITDAGQFGSSTGTDKLINAGFTNAAGLESADEAIGASYVSAIDPVYPISLTMTFDSAKEIDAFHLWNHGTGGNPNQSLFGVSSFDLEFYSDAAATQPIAEVAGLSAFEAPSSGEISVQTFAFGQVRGIKAVKMVVHSNLGGRFFAMREIGFNSIPPYQAWANRWGVDIGPRESDYDGDFANNLYEYALNGNPTNSLVKGCDPVLINHGGVIEYRHLVRSDDTNIIYTVETRDDLVCGIWSNTGYTVSGTDATDDESYDETTYTILTEKDRVFIRLKMEAR